jgi:hypothetical protein
MKRISIERYRTVPEDIPRPATPVVTGLGHGFVEDFCSGLIEGERDDGTTWIMFLDQNGSPECFWARRDEGGGVLGDPILLQPDQASAP